jgi:hypothetical protein
VRRRLMEHEERAREHELEAARSSRMHALDGFAEHIEWQAWHDRRAHKLQQKLAVLEAERWLARTSEHNAGSAGSDRTM